MTERDKQELLAFAGPQPKVVRYYFRGPHCQYTAIALTSAAAEVVIRSEHPTLEGKELELTGASKVPCDREAVRSMARREQQERLMQN